MSVEVNLRIGDEELVVERLDGRVKRIIYRGRRPLETHIFLSDREELRVLPRPPFGGDISAECLLIDMPMKITVPAEKTVEVKATIPMDIKLVLVSDGSEKELISVPVGLKYALYGPPDVGYLCRYVKAIARTEEGGEFTFNMGITVFNRHNEPVTFTKLVLPLSFFNEKVNHLQVVIESRNQALIFYKEEVSDVFGPIWLALRGKNKYIMSFGY